jgi:hypothetical protein
MKKFTSMKEIKSDRYATNDFLRNDLLKMIDENLSVNDESGILGKEELVDKFVGVLTEKLIKMEINLLENVSKNPAILKEYNSNPVDKELNTLSDTVNQIIKESIEAKEKEEKEKIEEANKECKKEEKEDDKEEENKEE